MGSNGMFKREFTLSSLYYSVSIAAKWSLARVQSVRLPHSQIRALCSAIHFFPNQLKLHFLPMNHRLLALLAKVDSKVQDQTWVTVIVLCVNMFNFAPARCSCLDWIRLCVSSQLGDCFVLCRKHPTSFHSLTASWGVLKAGILPMLSRLLWSPGQCRSSKVLLCRPTSRQQRPSII